MNENILIKKETCLFDKSEWLDGPWKEEPDEINFTDLDTGYECVIQRSDFTGTFCGYVAVEKNHPFQGKHYDELNIDVHGGLTFSETVEGKGMVFGFDCAHANDLMPILKMYFGEYRTVEYVIKEIKSLAKQLKIYENNSELPRLPT